MLSEKEILERAFQALDGLAARPVKSQTEAQISENYTSLRCTPETPAMSVETPPAEPPVKPPEEARKDQLFVPPEDSHKDSAASKVAEVVTDPTQEQIDQAGRILARAGVRLVGGVHGVDYVGVWSDLDSAEVRAAIAVFHPAGVPVRYLDGDVPMKYKWRKVPGEPVPANVLAAMEQEPDQPWVIRDRMLAEMNWTPDGQSWSAWKAQSLNKLFEEQGVLKQLAKILPKTVQHGERGRK